MPDSFNNISNFGSQAEEHAKQVLEKTQEHSIKAIESFTTIQDKDGKKVWMGMEVPAELAGTFQYVTSIMPTVVSDFLRDGVYHHSSTIYNKLVSPDLNSGHKAGLAAAAGMSALLIGMQPITGVAHSVQKRSKERADIKTALSSISESNKEGYKDNEVIKTALEHVNQTMVTGFKQAASEFPTVLLNGYYAVGSHKELKVKTTEELYHKQKGVAASGEHGIDPIMEEANRNKEAEKKLKDLIEKNPKDEKYIREAHQRQEEERLERQRASYSAEPSSKNPFEQPESASKTLALTGVGGLNVFLKQLVSKGSDDKDKTTAYQLIVKLQEKINSGNVSAGSNISDQIVEIFQQNEINRGRSGIGPALMEKLQPLAERIGEVIANRELDPLALVNLVGDGKIVNKRRFVKTDQLEKLIDNQRKIFGSHEKTPMDEFLTDFQSPKLVMAAIRDNLKDLKGNDKAVFASMFSNDVLLSSGIKKKDILPLRAQAHDYIGNFVKSATIELAQKTPEELKEKGLSEKQIESINSLNDHIVAGNEKDVKSTISRGDTIIGAVRNAKIHEQVVEGKGNSPWTKVIKKKPPITVKKTPDISAAERVITGREGSTPVSGIV